MIKKINKGDPITASFLNEISHGVDKIQEQFNSKNWRPQDAQGQESLPPTGEDGFIDEVWTEQTRTTTTERIYDPDDSSVYVDVDKMVTVTFLNQEGKLILLRFN